MRYRRLSYRYAMLVRSAPAWPLGDIWPSDRLRPLPRVGWRPDADMYETATALEVLVELAGLDEDDFEVQLFEDAGEPTLGSLVDAFLERGAGIR